MAEESMKVVIGADVNQGVAGINQFNKALARIKPGAAQATTAMTNLSRVVQDAPFGLIGIANNIDPLLLSFQQLRKETGSVGGAFKALAGSLMGGGGIALGVSLVTSLLVTYGDKLFNTKKATQELTEEEKKAADTRKGIISSIAEEASHVTHLKAILESENTTRKQKIQAIEELKKINPEYFGQLKLEGDTVDGLNQSYTYYIASLMRAARAKAVQAQVQELFAKRIDIELKQLEERNAAEDAFIKMAGRRPKLGELRTFDLRTTTVQSQLDEIDKRILQLLQRASEVNFEGLTKPEPAKKLKEAAEEIEKIRHARIINLEDIAAAQRLLDIINGIRTPKKAAFEGKPGEFTGLPTKEVIIKVATEAEKALDDLNEKLSAQMKTLASTLAVGFGESLGALLGGADFGQAISSFVALVGDAIISIGKIAIEAGVAMLELKAALTSMFANPTALIGVGIALVALGSLIKTKIPKFAEGGIVTRPTLGLFGEAGPEAVIPLHKMNGLGGGTVNVQGEFRIRGRDLVAVVATGQRTLNSIT